MTQRLRRNRSAPRGVNQGVTAAAPVLAGPGTDTDALFAQFVREHTPTLLRSAYLLTGNAPAAEELVQDTLVHLYPKWDRVCTADAPLAYVRRSMMNGFVNATRRPARREVLVDELPEILGGPDVAVHVTDQDLVWRLLATLPPRQRAALVLRYFHGAADDEIAKALDCRLGTVRSLISRGLATLRRETGDGDD